jgi:hypothetical protein
MARGFFPGILNGVTNLNTHAGGVLSSLSRQRGGRTLADRRIRRQVFLLFVFAGGWTEDGREPSSVG